MQLQDWKEVSKDYFKEISLSPFNKRVKNPLIKELNKIKFSKNKHLIDLGCGTGNLVSLIHKKFKSIAEVDYSPDMIEQNRKHNFKIRNINYFVRDIKDLSDFHNKFEVAVSVNSILDTSFFNLERTFHEVYKVLKKGGLFFGILPSMNSEIYIRLIATEYFYHKLKDEKKAVLKMREFIESSDVDYFLGIAKAYNEKYFYKTEVEYFLKTAGFKILKFDKVIYPWNLWREMTKEQLSWFNKRGKPWDLFVVAKK